MAHPNEDLIREGYAAFGRGDVQALRNKYMTDDIQWHVSGRSPVSGDHKGVAQVLDALGRLFELSAGTLRLALHDVLANDEHAVALLVASAEREGRRLDGSEVNIFHIRDGRIFEFWSVPVDAYASDEFWS